MAEIVKVLFRIFECIFIVYVVYQGRHSKERARMATFGLFGLRLEDSLHITAYLVWYFFEDLFLEVAAGI